MAFLTRKPAPEPSLVDIIMGSAHKMPDDELQWLTEAYAAASVILEYGSGRSTLVASGMPGKTLFSVESDADWVQRFQAHFQQTPPAARIHMHHVDIGKTGEWGNPADNSGWQRYHRYPLSVWDREDFTAPDLVLVDGRFRTACWVTTLLRIDRPTVVLFDDYTNRPQYHGVEAFAEPVATCGRMARFELTPRAFPVAEMTKILEMYTRIA